MAKHGTIRAFDAKEESWDSYVDQVDFYFEANEITNDNRKRALLLTSCGGTTYQLLKNLLQPQKPTEKTYKEIVDLLRNHFNPPPSVIVQRFKFNSRTRRPGESVATYIAGLKAIAEHCKYHDLTEMIRDRVVCGINDSQIQKRLLQEPDLTFAKAEEIALTMELATKDVADIQSSTATSTSQPIQRLHQPTTSKQHQTCYRCGGSGHSQSNCRFKNSKCHGCGKMGHISKVCRSKPKDSASSAAKPTKRGIHTVATTTDDTSELTDQSTQDTPDYTLFHLGGSMKPIQVEVQINKVNLIMELDTGASLSVISEQTLLNLGIQQCPQPTTTTLQGYSGDNIPIKGYITVEVTYESQRATLPLYIIKGRGPSLFGRNWLQAIKLNWTSIHAISSSTKLDQLLQSHSKVFANQLGTLVGTEAKIYVDSTAKPRFFRPRPLPYAMKEKVERELERLQEEGIIIPVTLSEWAAPVVPVQKADGKLRLCGDYRVTINQVCKQDTYPLPRAEDIFSILEGGQYFSKLDLQHAYQQVVLAEDSQKYTTINTHKGLFKYQRLPFGISSAPSLFQRLMENILQGIPKTAVYLDDILVTGATVEEHLTTLQKVLKRLEEAGLTLKQSKCVFMSTSLDYLGHVIDSAGLHPSTAKVKAIKEAPIPCNLTELKSFIGLVNYYRKFLPNLSTILAPLFQLQRKEVPWKWTEEHDIAVNKVKQLLSSSTVLAHFNSSQELCVACDASQYGLGAVLSHKFQDGSERPVAFTSRTLTAAERNYGQIEKEALAIVFAVKKFHTYLYGRKFTIYSDHKPLKFIFDHSKPVPHTASPRIARWALTLGGYQYTLTHKPGTDLGNADALSRLPLEATPMAVPVPGELLQLSAHLEQTSISAAHIKDWTNHCPLLSRVRHFILAGWTITEPDPELRPYFQRQHELSTHEGCLLWGSRVIIPPQGQAKVLQLLHETHPGETRMKSLARSYVWWPRIDKDVEECVKTCSVCQLHRSAPPKAPLHPWEHPRCQWSRLHIDHAGPFMGRHFLIVIDAYSKWLEVFPVTSTSAEVTMSKLRDLFAIHGLPEQIISDNGTGFSSAEFGRFTRANGIRHIFTAPYHPSSNGLAERAVRIFKETVVKLEGNMETRIAKFLFRYRVTPQTSTGTSPAELLMGRRLRTNLDLLHPDSYEKPLQKIKRHTIKRDLQVNDCALARDYQGPNRWIPVQVQGIRGPLSYTVITNDGRIWRRHIDQLRFDPSASFQKTSKDNKNAVEDWPFAPTPKDNMPDVTRSLDTQSTSESSGHLFPNPPRRSTRTRYPVNRYAPMLQQT